MEWLSILLVLICPLMMIFMMKGHHGGGHKQNQDYSGTEELNKKVNELVSENKELRKELRELSTLIKK